MLVPIGLIAYGSLALITVLMWKISSRIRPGNGLEQSSSARLLS